MLDPVQIPILLKAIDFLFDEGRKILEERRERRKMEANPPISEAQQPETAPAVSESEPKDQAKKDLVEAKVDESLWRDHEQEVQHLVRLLETYSRNYYLSKEQYAKWGSALVPPIITHNLTEAENAMAETLKQLETVLSKVYKKEINPNQ